MRSNDFFVPFLLFCLSSAIYTQCQRSDSIYTPPEPLMEAPARDMCSDIAGKTVKSQAESEAELAKSLRKAINEQNQTARAYHKSTIAKLATADADRKNANRILVEKAQKDANVSEKEAQNLQKELKRIKSSHKEAEIEAQRLLDHLQLKKQDQLNQESKKLKRLLKEEASLDTEITGIRGRMHESEKNITMQKKKLNELAAEERQAELEADKAAAESEKEKIRSKKERQAEVEENEKRAKHAKIQSDAETEEEARRTQAMKFLNYRRKAFFAGQLMP